MTLFEAAFAVNVVFFVKGLDSGEERVRDAVTWALKTGRMVRLVELLRGGSDEANRPFSTV